MSVYLVQCVNKYTGLFEPHLSYNVLASTKEEANETGGGAFIALSDRMEPSAE